MELETDAANSEGIIYQYRCRACEHEGWEVRHHVHETPSVTCPSCGSDDTHRLVGTPKVVLQGGGVGWARDGYYAYNNRDSLKALGSEVRDVSKEEFEAGLKGLK